MNQEESSQRSNIKKWLLIALVGLCVIVSWTGVIDNKTEKYVDDGIIKATIAYGSARALNAVISVAQSAQVGVSLGGEASFHPLEILDPVNDMVEDYATVMKYSIGSLIIQKLLVEILANNLFKWLMLGLGLLLIMSLLFLNGTYSSYLFKGFVFISLVRFMFIVTILLSTLVDSTYLQKQTDDQMKIVDQAVTEVGLANATNEDLTSEEKIAIHKRIQELQAQGSELAEEIQKQSEAVSNAQSKMESDKAKLAEVKSDKGVVEKLNIFSADEDITAAEEKLDVSEGVYNAIAEAQKELTEQLEDLQSSLADQQEELQGKKGFISDMKSKMAAAHSLFSTQKIKQTLESSIGAMLKLIAFFVFKTLIMPIVFLLLILRSSKWVWGYDPRTLLKRSMR